MITQIHGLDYEQCDKTKTANLVLNFVFVCYLKIFQAHRILVIKIFLNNYVETHDIISKTIIQLL